MVKFIKNLVSKFKKPIVSNNTYDSIELQVSEQNISNDRANSYVAKRHQQPVPVLGKL